MGWGRALVAGGIVAGAGFALQQIGNAIFSATGTTAGPVVNYGALIGAASIALYGIGGLLAVYGLLKGGYSLVTG
ncbi:MAG: hypothetical protein SVU88_03590, partial [Candidatus Nanohaloarchaea archaeon]|nr:hypothetical protein [Candidatus Nanohaloarchaea archaeon]